LKFSLGHRLAIAYGSGMVPVQENCSPSFPTHNPHRCVPLR
jgi:hypothetical protein